MSSPDIAGILDKSKELDQLRKEQEEVLTEINKMHKKLQATPEVVEKPGDNALAKLKALYVHAKELSENEMNVSNLLLSQLDALLPSGPPGQPRRRMEGNEQKRKRMKNDSDISRMSPPCEVAARVMVTTEDAEKEEWLVVKVLHFDKETRELEVLDEEPGDDEEGGGQRYLLEFDDDEEDGALPQRVVPFHKVVALPDGHRQ
ncbi:SGF29 tudor-like domain-containing protein [Prunus dulcis]|uniref:SGF29 tudor-like domain-containing protein n=1 Tax=Prunus dulcis TaxID=3755 RepID=A0A4Y1R8V3_PRUDU|nr:SGF29 tudor-like domain-containing protein [Prunus dulcis]